MSTKRTAEVITPVLVRENGIEFLCKRGAVYYCEDCGVDHISPDCHAEDFETGRIFCQRAGSFDCAYKTRTSDLSEAHHA